MIYAALVFLLLANTLFGQTVTLQQQLTGVDAIAQIGNLTVCGKDSKPQLKPIAVIDTHGISEESVQAFSLPDGKIAIATKASENIWYIDQPGRWIVVVSGVGVKVPIHSIQIGGVTPPPVPPGPGPQPPTPTPDPVPAILDEYHVGLVAFQNSPKDTTLARWTAELYRAGAGRLFGQGGLSDIRSIMAEIGTKFANRQCTDQAVCEQWGRWKQAVDAALIAEQRRRGTFSREDWFKALWEVAQALEAVK